jgi:hypothetical protein
VTCPSKTQTSQPYPVGWKTGLERHTRILSELRSALTGTHPTSQHPGGPLLSLPRQSSPQKRARLINSVKNLLGNGKKNTECFGKVFPTRFPSTNLQPCHKRLQIRMLQEWILWQRACLLDSHEQIGRKRLAQTLRTGSKRNRPSQPPRALRTTHRGTGRLCEEVECSFQPACTSSR